MIDAPLKKEVWVFPIYKYGTKKYIPMKYALLLAYAIPTITIILLSPFTTSNALLYQIEYILVAFFYGLLGVLTRSKLRSFLNFIPAFASYLTVEFVVQGLLNFKPPINDPYAFLNIASRPITDILSSDPSLAQYASLPGLLFVGDLFIIFLFAEIGGLFTATISTGFWNPRGQFSIVAVIAKMIAIPIALILIILLPLFFHGFNSFVDGGSYLAAGTYELSQAFSGGTAGATTAQTGSLNVTALREHAEKAGYYFSVANDKFGNLKGNILLQAILSYITSTYPSMAGLENITNVLDLIGSISEVSYVTPELFLGFNALITGFQQTFSYIGTATDTYNPKFKEGLTDLNYAFNNFTLAWNKKDNATNQIHGLEQAIFRATSLENVPALANYVNIGQFINALNTSMVQLLGINEAFIQFLNGTYETTIGLANMAENKLTQTNFWMDSAIADFKLSNQTLGSILVPQPVVFEFYPNGDGGKTKVNKIEIPIDGIIRMAKDFNALLIYFAYAGLSSINMFNGMAGVMTSIGNVNWNNTVNAASSNFWSNLATNVTIVNNTYAYGIANLTLAQQQSAINANHSYGQLLDPAFKNNPNSIFNTINEMLTNMEGNFTDYGHMLNALTNTVYAYRDFSLGSDQFSTWLSLYQANGNNRTAAVNATGQIAIANFTSSMHYAYNGYLALQQTVSMDAMAKASWESMLYSPSNNGTISDTSLSGADYSGIFIIHYSLSPSQDPILNIVVQLLIGDVLGTG